MVLSARQPRILIVCGQPLPLQGQPATGVGLRAWALGQGLRTHGIEVIYAIPDDILPKDLPETPDLAILPFAYHELDRCVDQAAPAVILLIGWTWANLLTPRPDVGLAIDLTGPYIIENLYSKFQDPVIMPWLKIQALQKADFLICGGAFQRHYFLSWLMLAGYDMADPPFEVVHMALDPVLPDPVSPDEPTFVHGGLFLPWQDPTAMLRRLVRRLEDRRKGRLIIIGGAHPSYPFPTGNAAALAQELERHPQVEVVGLIPYETYVERSLRCSVAVDLMERNVERELAFPHRTIVSLWCGLPVIFNNYSELSSHIRDYEAGWTLAPGDMEGLDQVIDDILDNPGLVQKYKQNARRLVRERFTWDRTADPLVDYCKRPVKRVKGPSLLDQSIHPLDDRIGRMMLKLKRSPLYRRVKSAKHLLPLA